MGACFMLKGCKTGSVILPAFLLSACLTNPTQTARFDDSIADRAIEINEAYNAELNGQILKNILRARDRLPRFYTTLSDLTITPNAKTGGSAGLNGIGIGDANTPWGTLGLGASHSSSSTVTLTISPNAKKKGGDKPETIYHSPIDINTFLTYYNDWDASVVDNLMIDQIRAIEPGNTVGGEDVISKILADSDGHFKVFIGEGLRSGPKVDDCAIAANCQTLTAYYCIDAGACASNPEGGYNLTGRHQATVRSNIDDLSGRDNINLRSKGALFVCAIGNAVTQSQGPMATYDCHLANAALSVNGPASLIYVGQLDGIGDDEAMYALTLSSIDNMIYKLGSSVRNRRTDFFRVSQGVTGGCKDAYAAKVKYNDETYYAGPPRGHKDDTCYQDDKSGTLMTLIAELIKLREVNAELVTSSLFITN